MAKHDQPKGPAEPTKSYLDPENVLRQKIRNALNEKDANVREGVLERLQKEHEEENVKELKSEVEQEMAKKRVQKEQTEVRAKTEDLARVAEKRPASPETPTDQKILITMKDAAEAMNKYRDSLRTYMRLLQFLNREEEAASPEKIKASPDTRPTAYKLEDIFKTQEGQKYLNKSGAITRDVLDSDGKRTVQRYTLKKEGEGYCLEAANGKKIPITEKMKARFLSKKYEQEVVDPTKVIDIKLENGEWKKAKIIDKHDGTKLTVKIDGQKLTIPASQLQTYRHRRFDGQRELEKSNALSALKIVPEGTKVARPGVEKSAAGAPVEKPAAAPAQIEGTPASPSPVESDANGRVEAATEPSDKGASAEEPPAAPASADTGKDVNMDQKIDAVAKIEDLEKRKEAIKELMEEAVKNAAKAAPEKSEPAPAAPAASGEENPTTETPKSSWKNSKLLPWNWEWKKGLKKLGGWLGKLWGKKTEEGDAEEESENEAEETESSAVPTSKIRTTAAPSINPKKPKSKYGPPRLPKSAREGGASPTTPPEDTETPATREAAPTRARTAPTAKPASAPATERGDNAEYLEKLRKMKDLTKIKELTLKELDALVNTGIIIPEANSKTGRIVMGQCEKWKKSSDGKSADIFIAGFPPHTVILKEEPENPTAPAKTAKPAAPAAANSKTRSKRPAAGSTSGEQEENRSPADWTAATGTESAAVSKIVGPIREQKADTIKTKNAQAAKEAKAKAELKKRVASEEAAHKVAAAKKKAEEDAFNQATEKGLSEEKNAGAIDNDLAEAMDYTPGMKIETRDQREKRIKQEKKDKQQQEKQNREKEREQTKEGFRNLGCTLIKNPFNVQYEGSTYEVLGWKVESNQTKVFVWKYDAEKRKKLKIDLGSLQEGNSKVRGLTEIEQQSKIEKRRQENERDAKGFEEGLKRAPDRKNPHDRSPGINFAAIQEQEEAVAAAKKVAEEKAQRERQEEKDSQERLKAPDITNLLNNPEKLKIFARKTVKCTYNGEIYHGMLAGSIKNNEESELDITDGNINISGRKIDKDGRITKEGITQAIPLPKKE